MKKMMVKVILALGLAFSVAGTVAAPLMIDKPLAGKSQVSVRSGVRSKSFTPIIRASGFTFVARPASQSLIRTRRRT
jgi:hypothetical protein